ncbi:hypothetical protein OTU49_008251, partial [Cherax quadricarinatus]
QMEGLKWLTVVMAVGWAAGRQPHTKVHTTAQLLSTEENVGPHQLVATELHHDLIKLIKGKSLSQLGDIISNEQAFSTLLERFSALNQALENLQQAISLLNAQLQNAQGRVSTSSEAPVTELMTTEYFTSSETQLSELFTTKMPTSPEASVTELVTTNLSTSSEAFRRTEEPLTTLQPCNLETHFECDNGSCLSRNLLCDASLDCQDGTDESPDCSTGEVVCEKSEFKCVTTNICVPALWRCDGDPDCGGSSDED